MLAEGPSNGLVMVWQTLFGTVVKKGQFFKGLPSADDDAAYYEVVFVVCNHNFLSTKRGVGWGFGQL